MLPRRFLVKTIFGCPLEGAVLWWSHCEIFFSVGEIEMAARRGLKNKQPNLSKVVLIKLRSYVFWLADRPILKGKIKNSIF